MKSQINFFITRNDQAELIRQLGGLGNFVCLDTISLDGAPRILESAEINEMGHEPLQIFIALQKNVSDIVLKELLHVTFRSVDVVRSPVVEFARCYQDEHCVRRGRLYFIKGYYDQSAIFSKDEEFLKWGDGLIISHCTSSSAGTIARRSFSPKTTTLALRLACRCSR